MLCSLLSAIHRTTRLPMAVLHSVDLQVWTAGQTQSATFTMSSGTAAYRRSLGRCISSCARNARASGEWQYKDDQYQG